MGVLGQFGQHEPLRQEAVSECAQNKSSALESSFRTLYVSLNHRNPSYNAATRQKLSATSVEQAAMTERVMLFVE